MRQWFFSPMKNHQLHHIHAKPSKNILCVKIEYWDAPLHPQHAMIRNADAQKWINKLFKVVLFNYVDFCFLISKVFNILVLRKLNHQEPTWVNLIYIKITRLQRIDYNIRTCDTLRIQFWMINHHGQSCVYLIRIKITRLQRIEYYVQTWHHENLSLKNEPPSQILGIFDTYQNHSTSKNWPQEQMSK